MKIFFLTLSVCCTMFVLWQAGDVHTERECRVLHIIALGALTLAVLACAL